MATQNRTEILAHETRSAGGRGASATLTNITRVARLTLVGSGGLALLLGLVIWTANADQLRGVHQLFGYILILSLWTLAAIAARSGVPVRLVALAVVWSLAAPVLGVTQEGLVEGDWHWTIQVLHLVIAMGVIAWGQVLVRAMRQTRAPW